MPQTYIDFPFTLAKNTNVHNGIVCLPVLFSTSEK